MPKTFRRWLWDGIREVPKDVKKAILSPLTEMIFGLIASTFALSIMVTISILAMPVLVLSLLVALHGLYRVEEDC